MGFILKKICLVIPSLAIGGAERVVSNLANKFVDMGYDVKIVLFYNVKEYSVNCEVISLDLPASKNIFRKIYNLFMRVWKLKQILEKIKPDLIISFLESANFVSILTGFGVIVSTRCNLDYLNFMDRLLVRYLYKKKNVKKVIAVSKGIEKSFNEEFGIFNTSVIYNPIIVNNNYNTANDLSFYKPYILSVGRLTYQKNFKLLIESFGRSNSSLYINLIIVGDGEDRVMLEDKINTMNLNKKVFLVGKKNNVFDYYNNALFYVMSSRYEGFPNVLVEALYSGLPCISTDCPTGPNEIIIHGYNGLLVKNENEEELTKAIDTMFFDKDFYLRLKSNARDSVNHLHIDVIAKKWLELME